jgi:2-iminobutanoate/2-iminopropanoate deaminase
MPREAINPPGLFDSLQYGFSQGVAVASGRRLFLSGQVATDEHGRTTATTLPGQFAASLDNIEVAVAAAGGSLDDVAMLRIYLVDRDDLDLDGIAQVLRGRFPNDPPASSWVVVSGLARDDWLVEVEAEAVLVGPE